MVSASALAALKLCRLLHWQFTRFGTFQPFAKWRYILSRLKAQKSDALDFGLRPHCQTDTAAAPASPLSRVAIS